MPRTIGGIECRVPGCDNRIRADSVSKVCAAHLHHVEWCDCLFCRRRKPPKEKIERPDVRTHIVSHVNTTTPQITKIPVSLPREPWM